MQSAKMVDGSKPHSRVRQELDTARFSWFHVKAILVAGVGCVPVSSCWGPAKLKALPFAPARYYFLSINNVSLSVRQSGKPDGLALFPTHVPHATVLQVLLVKALCQQKLTNTRPG